ncbi:MAG: hypothetical protein EBS73_15645, partial [Betaproteobacteria bacterium]|nr:hypothetical protein [Betaproteobacteria bacterium]
MREPTALLHNMSAPPKSVVRYSGLSGLLQQRGPGGTGITSLHYNNGQQHGEAVRFELPAHFNFGSPEEILRSLGHQHDCEFHGTESRYLLQLINRRATELPLPEGCAVVKSLETHSRIWSDPLAALVALTKCTDSVWLRAKT